MKLHLIFVIHYILQSSATAEIQFTSKYSAQAVAGLVNSSFNFSWSFSGDVKDITWGVWDTTSKVFLTELVKVTQSAAVLVSSSSTYYGRVVGSRRGSSPNGEVIFTLLSITEKDETIYGCVLYPRNHDSKTKYDTVKLVVKEKPSISHLTVNSSGYNEGSRVNLQCGAKGKPEPDVRWIHDGYIKTSGTKRTVLIFSAINRTDAGSYTCSANNSVGSSEKQVDVVVNYAANIRSIALLTTESWVGQTITLKCVADGVPTPTLIWKQPDGTDVNKVTALENAKNVTMRSDKDFGNYTCHATNGLGATATSTVQVHQIKAPGSPSVEVEIHATSIKVWWSKPTDDGGSPITAYRVLILGEKKIVTNVTIPNLSTKDLDFGGLTTSTNYTLRVFARNYVFEGNATEKKIQTKFQGVPGAAEIIDLPDKTKDIEITVKWKQAENNGAEITQYTLYRRRVYEDGTSQNWTKLKEITNTSDRKVVVYFEKGKEYDIVVTATNEFGEGGKEEGKIRKIMVLGDSKPTAQPKTDGSKPSAQSKTDGLKPSAQAKTDGMNTAVIAGAAAVSVLVIVGVIIFATWWKRRKSSQDDASPSASALRGDNPYELDDGYQDVSASVAAQGLQAEADSVHVAEPDYAQVDMSKKKRNRRPVTDEYAQVDKSKKSKKPKKQPGELNYAELDDFRPSGQPAAAAAAAAEAAPARPLIRRPAYEGTEYADITQFGVPQPEPTYGNISKKDVVYSNVQGI